MMKPQHPRSILPLLLCAASLPAHAQVLGVAAVDAAGGAIADGSASLPLVVLDAAAEPKAPADAEARSSAAWESVLARRHQASLLSQRQEWVAAASCWREVLFALRQIEPLEARASERGKLLKQEAEREMARAHSHPGAFWSVRDLVTPGADSRNSAPILAPQPAGSNSRVLNLTLGTGAFTRPASSQNAQAPGGAVVSSSALVRRPPTGAARLQAARLAPAPVAAKKVAGVARLHKPLATGAAGKVRRQQADGSHAALLWAQAQWWARPLVDVGSDSRNSAPSATRPRSVAPSSSRLALTPGEGYLSSALVKAPPVMVRPPASLTARLAPALPAPEPGAPEPGAPAAGGPAAPVKTGRSWTMQVHLPSASEAARAAQRPLGS